MPLGRRGARFGAGERRSTRSLPGHVGGGDGSPGSGGDRIERPPTKGADGSWPSPRCGYGGRERTVAAKGRGRGMVACRPAASGGRPPGRCRARAAAVSRDSFPGSQAKCGRPTRSRSGAGLPVGPGLSRSGAVTPPPTGPSRFPPVTTPAQSFPVGPLKGRQDASSSVQSRFVRALLSPMLALDRGDC